MAKGRCWARRIAGFALLIMGIGLGTIGGGLIIKGPEWFASNIVPWLLLALCATVIIMLGAHWLFKKSDGDGTR